jgi:hypothetical protein
LAKRVVKRKPNDQAFAIEKALGGSTPAQQAATAKEGKQRRHFTADEFIAWAEENCYRDDKLKGWVPLTYTGWQKRAIREMMELREDGTLRYVNWMFCWPRRCGKSEGAGVYDVCRAIRYDDQVIVVQGNSDDQGEDTVLKEIVDKLLNSPKLKARVSSAYGQKITSGGDIEIISGLITFGKTGSVIKVQPAKAATTYGQKIHVYHNTEGCVAANDKLYQTGASSTGDAWCGVAIIDSNMGDKTNFVCVIAGNAASAAEERARAVAENRPPNPQIGDPATCASYLSFENLDDVLKRGCGEGLPPGQEPIHPWLKPEWIRSRYANMIRSEFLRNHCNQPSGQGDELWASEQIDPLFIRGLPQYCLDPAMLAMVARMIGSNGRWRIGAGLDRAGAFSKVPDRTVLAFTGETVIEALIGAMVPVYDEHGIQVATEPCNGTVYVLLGAFEYMFHLRDPLQAKLLQIDRAVGLGAVLLEAYQASDLAEWAQTQRFGEVTHICHMTPQAKQQLVHFTHGLVITRRLLVSPAYGVLHAEFCNYREDASGGGIPSYGGGRKTMDLDVSGNGRKATTWIKDDYLESLMWSIEAARNARQRFTGGGIFEKPPGF